MRTIILSSILAFGLIACGSDEITQSGGEFMEEYMGTVCQRLAECGLLEGTSQSDCVDLTVGAVCSENDCTEKFTVNAGEWNDCLDAEENLACSSAEAAITPSECQDIELF